jgi:hypothetical protein
MNKTSISKRVDNFFRESLGTGFYVATYPFLKWYFNNQSKKYAQQLVEITETPLGVLKEPIVIEPTVKYPSMVSKLFSHRELLEKRKNKRHVYVSAFSINGDDIIEEVSHEIRNRICEDKDPEVSEFFGMVGRILIKDPKISFDIPTVEKIAKWEEKNESRLEQLYRAKEKDKADMKSCDKETFIRKSEEAGVPKKGIDFLKALPTETFRDPRFKEVWIRLSTTLKYNVTEALLKNNLFHADGYEAALRNKDSIEKNPKGIYLLSEEEVRQRFF